jgi:acetamidase/formamidase
MKRATKDILYFETGPRNEPTLWVELGEEFEVETQMNRGPWLDDHPKGEELSKKLRGGNPSSGCIYIQGAEPGQLLSVHIGPIDVDPIGFTRFAGANGAMPGYLGATGVGEHSKVVEIHDGLVHWSEELKLGVRPMLGFVGVAPKHECFHNGWAAQHGGNFDAQEITAGATVQLRVNVPGALLHIGDMHAIQGDGEICGAGGIETGGRVRVRCELSDLPDNMAWPRLIDETHIGVLVAARPAEDAFRLALQDLILWLEEDYLVPRGEAYLLLGQVLEARCTAFVNPTFTYIAKVAKRYLPSR